MWSTPFECPGGGFNEYYQIYVRFIFIFDSCWLLLCWFRVFFLLFFGKLQLLWSLLLLSCSPHNMRLRSLPHRQIESKSASTNVLLVTCYTFANVFETQIHAHRDHRSIGIRSSLLICLYVCY